MNAAFCWVRPLFLYALAALPLFFTLRFLALRRLSIAYSPVQYHPPSRLRRTLPLLAISLETLILGAVLAALAGPAQVNRRSTVTQEGVDAALVLDISASMQADDFQPTRLDCLKKLATDFVRRSGTNRLGVFAFAGDCYTQSPFTSDHTVLATLIDDLAFESIDHTESGGTAVGDALVLAVKALRRIKVKGRDQALILITDGQSNLGLDPAVAVKYLKAEGIRFYAVGVGGDKPVKLFVHGKPFINTQGVQVETVMDDAELRKLTRLADGRFYRARDAKLFQQIFEEMARLEVGPVTVGVTTRTESLAPWAALLAAVLFAAWWAVWGFGVRRPFR